MRYIKMLGLLMAAAAAFAALAASASATTLTSPQGTAYAGDLQLTSTNWKLDGPFITLECTHSVIKGNVGSHGAGVPVRGDFSEWYFAGCDDYPVKGDFSGSFEINSSNEVRSTGATIHATTSLGTCDWSTNITLIGTITEGASASLDVGSSKIPRTSGSFLCGSSGTMTGSYDFVTPNELWVD